MSFGRKWFLITGYYHKAMAFNLLYSLMKTKACLHIVYVNLSWGFLWHFYFSSLNCSISYMIICIVCTSHLCSYECAHFSYLWTPLFYTMNYFFIFLSFVRLKLEMCYDPLSSKGTKIKILKGGTREMSLLAVKSTFVSQHLLWAAHNCL